jgi:tyrosinase
VTVARTEDLRLSRRGLLRLGALAGAGVAGAGVAGVGVAGAGVAGAGVAGAALAGRVPAQQQINIRPVRREIGTAAALRDVASYRTAVAAMRRLPAADPRNWTRQAQLHLDHGRHASWLFLPWHRAYLYYFEQICRELSGHAGFALPYWNWTANPRIPATFWDRTSPLFHPWRDATAESVAAADFVGPAVVGPMLDEANFLLFGGPLTGDAGHQDGPEYGLVEQSPHNYIHGFVGGTMATFASPLDPLFWVHQSRIDQLWTQWNVEQDHPNPDDPAWWGTEFTEFCDGHGQPVRINVLTTILMPLVSYQFDTQATP